MQSIPKNSAFIFHIYTFCMNVFTHIIQLSIHLSTYRFIYLKSLRASFFLLQTHAHTHTHTHTYIYTYIYIYIYIYIYVYIHTYIYIYIYVCVYVITRVFINLYKKHIILKHVASCKCTSLAICYFNYFFANHIKVSSISNHGM